MSHSEDLDAALNNLDNQFQFPQSITPKDQNQPEEIQRKPEESSNVSNFQNNPNQVVIEEENGLLSNPSPSSYRNEPHREKYLGVHLKRRLPASLLPDRKIYVGIQDPMVPNNSISTSKYNVLSFWPMNLFEQFSKMANIYFLLIAVLQIIPDISNTNSQPLQLVPLMFIIAVSMVKDAFEDYKRHKSDFEENNKETLVFRNGEFIKILWKDLRIGDVIKVREIKFSAFGHFLNYFFIYHRF